MTVSAPAHVHHVQTGSTSIDWPYDAWEQVMCCRECARRVLLMMLKSPAWVLRRVERVSFHDDRTARRRVSTDFSIPELAPCYQDGNTRVRLVPLTVMRRKTLVNFGLTDAEGKALSLVSMRHNQVLTEQIVLALADIITGATHSEQLKEFAGHLASGTQKQLLQAFENARSGQFGPNVSKLLADPAAEMLLHKLANNFILLITVEEVGPPRRIVRFFYDEPLTLTYKASGYNPNTHKIEPAQRLPSWSRESLKAATGHAHTVIRFPVPAAENTLSYHFEIEAPAGVQIASASLLADRPNERRKDPRGHEVGPSWDHVEGGFPVVGLHVCGVPNGSMSQAQVQLRLSRRGWLTASLCASWASAALLWLTAFTAPLWTGTSNKEGAATTLLTITAAVLAFVVRPVEHQMASRLVIGVRAATWISMILLVVVGALIGLLDQPPGLVLQWIPAALATVCALLVSDAWWRARPSDTQISPWEQGLSLSEDHKGSTAFKTFEEARTYFNFHRPAVLVASSEGHHPERFQWTQNIEDVLIKRLETALGCIKPKQITAKQNLRSDRDGLGPRSLTDRWLRLIHMRPG